MSKKRARTVRSPPTAAIGPSPGRVEVVDALRGVAIATMIAYHFCFDLTWVGWADWPMLTDARWIAWRSMIVTSFLLLVGVSLALRDARAPSAAWFERAFLRRWLQIAAAALLVTAGSALLFPDSFIYFGVLHFVAVATWLCRRAPRRPALSLAVAVVVLVFGVVFSDPWFDPKTIAWIGFAADKPRTEDFVPLFPWLGVVLIGCGLGGFWARRDLRLSAPVAALWHALPRGLRRMFAIAGRWSLTIYLLHQPILLGAMTAIRQMGST